MQVEFKELSPAKLNLFLKIISKRDDGYHNIRSGVTIINLYDEVIAEKNSIFKVKYIGRFAPKNNKFSNCIIEKLFSKFKLPKPDYSFTIKKNIPVKSGLGSASSNVAAVIRILEKLNYKDIENKNFSEIGADVPFFIRNQDSLVRGIGDITVQQQFPKYYFLLVKPIKNCSTIEMYNQINLDNMDFDLSFDTNEICEHDSGNDFEFYIKEKYNEISSLLNFLKDLPDVIFTRLTGSGSCVFAAFSSKKNAVNSSLIFKNKFPNLWFKVVENNLL